MTMQSDCPQTLLPPYPSIINTVTIEPQHWYCKSEIDFRQEPLMLKKGKEHLLIVLYEKS